MYMQLSPKQINYGNPHRIYSIEKKCGNYILCFLVTGVANLTKVQRRSPNICVYHAK